MRFPSLDDLLGHSRALSGLLDGAQRMAESDGTILILGEAGSGRSTLARALHHASPRAHAALVEVDPGTIPASLFEGELFGYEAGAFTGAEHSSPGRVARAAGGTLLLDHIEELPLAVQPKLLRLLAERRYASLGGRERDADVRIIAVAASDLAFRVEKSLFRSDLYYRLDVLTLSLPALKERRDEIGAIAKGMVADLAERLGRRAPELAPQALEWMMAYEWPGNLRELRNVLEHTLILSSGEPLNPPPRRSGAAPPRPLTELEEEAIRQALAHTGGRQGRAAELLGISRKTLWKKRRQYGIP
ncbi:MAG TPA: sigma-54 dependent transcriptional regulator [Thermoanaerobaculia bacterium]|nr:sigma-54 dependent transcriptional regulator [Thermoanaerobaculia bacterium]